jgi:hypothetical protein
MGKGEIQIPFPVRGQAYLDSQNRRWKIRAIRPLGAAGKPYYVLEIDLQPDGGRSTRLMMSSREFFKLAESGYLKPLA